MALTPDEETMHLEVRALMELKPNHPEVMYIYRNALAEFFDTNAKVILSILDQHFKQKSKE